MYGGIVSFPTSQNHGTRGYHYWKIQGHMMESQYKTIGVGISSRPLANYHPNVWGDRFLPYIPESRDEVHKKQLVEELKEEVKRELHDTSDDYTRQLKLVDTIQRLGIEYHFEQEIDQTLLNLSQKLDNYCKNNHDLCTVALGFRLLRQHGHKISCKIFDKFKDEKGVFKTEDVAGMLEFFEATHLRIHGEDILDHAYDFTRNYLQSILPSLGHDDHVAQQVNNALYGYSNRRGLPRVEARHYISIYGKCASHHPVLLKLAKLDFNLLQSMHKRELSELYRWWKGLEVTTKLPYARDRLVETYFWIVGVYFEPKYGVARKFLTKLQSIGSLFDDTYDAYGIHQELQLFTDAIERWDISCLDQLPDYMQIIYKALMEIFEEVKEEMIRQGTSYRINYGIEAMKVMARDYFYEAKNWREAKYKPKMEEYMQVATSSTAYTSLMIISFLGMPNFVKKQHFDWVLSKPHIVRATLIICRLTDDIVGHEFERQREHIPSSIECYMDEHKVSKEETISVFKNQIEDAWKYINEAFLSPTKVPVPILYRILNFARVIEVIYSKGDWYTNVGPEMQSFINQLFIDPIP
uniref:Terpene synthase 4 n=1 Tax=Scutellaria barbata TaxID=396367 RepID=A0A6B7LHM1_9LAMI|nr:terpene synthase 4 [Scutellaria barbata]